MTTKAPTPERPRLLEQVRERLRVKPYSIRTEQVYTDWIKRLILLHVKRQPETMSAPEIEAFLTHLAVQRKVSASTQNQAKSALLFLYREVLVQELPWLDNVTWQPVGLEGNRNGFRWCLSLSKRAKCWAVFPILIGWWQVCYTVRACA